MAPTGGIEELMENLRESIALARPNGLYRPTCLHAVESSKSELAGSGYGRSALAVEIAGTFIEQRILR